MKNTLYFLKDNNTQLFWDGRYHSKDWSTRPRFFRTAAALYSSLNGLIPLSWCEEYEKTLSGPFPLYPKGPSNTSIWREEYNIFRSACCLRREEWEKYVKDNKLKSIDILKMLEYKGIIVFSLEEGKTMKSAKNLK